MEEAIIDEPRHRLGLAEEGEALEGADADMAARVGEGSSPRSSASPVSISEKLLLVSTPSASSISVASTSRTPPFNVSRPSPKRL